MGYGYGYGGWKPYVPVAARRREAEKAAAKAMKKSGVVFSPIAPYRGAISKTFWGKAWCDNLERYSDFANRLERGRTYVRNGSVIDLQLARGMVKAQVMGSALYQVEIRLHALEASHWKKVCSDCAGSIDSLVSLLQGKLSAAVMEGICKPGTGLFPSPKEISFECSCPDWAGMCKHVAAVLYGVGARLDSKPELLFDLRGVHAAELVSQAASGLRRVKPAAGTSAKRLDAGALGDVFGLEMAVQPEKAPGRSGVSGASSGSARTPVSRPPAGKKAVAGAPRKTTLPANTPVSGKKAGVKSVAKKAVPAKRKPSAVAATTERAAGKKPKRASPAAKPLAKPPKAR